MDRVQRDFQKDYFENMELGLTYRQVVNRMLAQKGKKKYSIRMFHPDERDREPWSTLVAKHNLERRIAE